MAQNIIIRLADHYNPHKNKGSLNIKIVIIKFQFIINYLFCQILYHRMKTTVEMKLISDDATQEQANRFDALSKIDILAYGVGHFVNDLVAACWFNYLFFYLKKVVETEAATAALLVGQIFDGIATPIVGLLSDKFQTRIGKRKPWYIGGLILLICCFIPLFSGFKGETLSSQYAFYIIFPALLNIGWAAVQISHMSLVPSLTCSRKRRDELNNLRNLFTFISNFTVLGIGLVIFSVMSDIKLQYQLIAYISLALGVLASAFFIKQINEPLLVKFCNQKQEQLRSLLAIQKGLDHGLVRSISDISLGQEKTGLNSQIKKRASKWDWFKMPKFYLFGVCYMCVRLYTNIFGTLLPFYLIDVLKMGTSDPNVVSYNLALVPMLAYASSVLVSTQLNTFYIRFGRKKALFMGTTICLLCLFVMFLINQHSSWLMYILPFLIGASQSLLLATGINLISEVVGSKGSTGAFVFGIYSLLDKFSSGIVIFMVGNASAYSKQSKDITVDDQSFIRMTMILIPGISCLLSSLIVLSYPIEQYVTVSKSNQNLSSQKSQLEQQLVY